MEKMTLKKWFQNSSALLKYLMADRFEDVTSACYN